MVPIVPSSWLISNKINLICKQSDPLFIENLSSRKSKNKELNKSGYKGVALLN